MLWTLKYGENSRLELDLATETLVPEAANVAPGSQDAAVSAVAAVDRPLDFPPLRQAVVPGDRVVLAIASDVPQAAEVVAAIVPALVEGGVTPEDVTVLQTLEDVNAGQPDPRSQLPDSLLNSVQLFTHNPAEQTQLSYLAADDHAEPIYLNRRMCEADFVIPIGCVRSDELASGNGKGMTWNETIFPTFGDRKTIDQLAPSGIPLTKGQLAHRHKQIDEIAWLLGVQVTAQVVPGGDGQSREVLIGAPDSVFRDGRKLCEAAWRRTFPRRASLVIAAIGGGLQQNWENVGRALKAALQVVADGGAIVLCTEVKEPLGPALRQLAAAADAESAQQRLRKLHSSDAELARLLATSLDRASVYLLSQLEEDVVAPLGFAYIAEPAEVVRLATRYDSCILLADAQYAMPTVEGE